MIVGVGEWVSRKFRSYQTCKHRISLTRCNLCPRYTKIFCTPVLSFQTRWHWVSVRKCIVNLHSCCLQRVKLSNDSSIVPILQHWASSQALHQWACAFAHNDCTATSISQLLTKNKHINACLCSTWSYRNRNNSKYNNFQ